MKKAVCLVETDPAIKIACNRIRELCERTQERAAFLQKQANDLRDHANKAKTESWDEIIAVLKSQGKLPEDYSKERYTLFADDELSVIFISPIEKNPSNPLMDFLRPFMG